MSLRRIHAGAGLIAASMVIELWSLWLGYFAPNAVGDPARVPVLAALFVTMLGAATWLLVQPWRRRVLVFAVIVTTLWSMLHALALASELVRQSNPNLGLELIALVISGVGLGTLPFAEAWAVVLTVRVGALMTLIVGVASTVMGGAHLLGVLGNAAGGAYPLYDFRLASMLSIGIMMVVAGTLCLAAVSGLRRGQRHAWYLALGGMVLLLLVAVPLCFVPGQGDLAAILTFIAAPSLFVLVARRQLWEHTEWQPS